MEKLKAMTQRASECLNKTESFFLFVARFTVGFVFAQAGWGKLQNLEGTIGFFSSLGIPLASIQAPFVAVLELVGGLLLIMGLFSRFISVPLIFTMFVALITAHASDIGGLGDLFGEGPFLYLIIMALFVGRGAGCWSLDRWLKFEK